MDNLAHTSVKPGLDFGSDGWVWWWCEREREKKWGSQFKRVGSFLVEMWENEKNPSINDPNSTEITWALCNIIVFFLILHFCTEKRSNCPIFISPFLLHPPSSFPSLISSHYFHCCQVFLSLSHAFLCCRVFWGCFLHRFVIWVWTIYAIFVVDSLELSFKSSNGLVGFLWNGLRWFVIDEMKGSDFLFLNFVLFSMLASSSRSSVVCFPFLFLFLFLLFLDLATDD